MTTAGERTWRFPRRMLVNLLTLTALVWAGFVAAMAVIVAGVAIWGEIDGSVWSGVASQIGRWYVLFIGVYVAYYQLPLHVTHGQTRRDFAIQGAIFTILFAAASAVLILLGSLIETVAYRIADWPLDIDDDHLYSSTTDVVPIFVENWLVFLVWFAIGALIGAGFYRADGLGFILIPVALVPVALTDLALAESWSPLTVVAERFLDFGDVPVAVSILLPIACCAGVLALTWTVIRDIPIQSRTG